MTNKFSFIYQNSISFFLLTICIFIDLSTVDIVNQFNIFSNIGNLKIIFVIITCLGIIGTSFLLFQTRSIVFHNKHILNTSIIFSSKSIICIEILLIGLLTTIIFQIVYHNNYSIFLSILIVSISYSIGLLFTVLLSIRFINWYRNEKEFLILSNVIAIILMFILIFFSILYFLYESIDDFDLVLTSMNMKHYIIHKNTILNIFENYYEIFYIATFISIGIISISLLRTYIQNLNKYVFLFIFSIPLIYFLVIHLPFTVDWIRSLILINPYLFGTTYTIIFSGTGLFTGFLFFLPFWFFAKRTQNNEIKKFLTMTSFGLLLFFTINQEPPLQEKVFPPFGIISASVTGLSIFLIFFGIYSTAIYLSKIKYFTNFSLEKLQNEKFFKPIARSQLEYELNKVITNYMRKNPTPSSTEFEMDQTELNSLLENVKKELSKTKKL